MEQPIILFIHFSNLFIHYEILFITHYNVAKCARHIKKT